MHDSKTLPLHPNLRHPLTGEPLRAIYVRRDGRVMWPIMGGAPDDDMSGGDGAGGSGGGTDEPPAGGGTGGSGGTSGDNRDLGFPRDTPVAEMTEKEQAAYWKHQSRRHEGRYKDLIGDRSPDDIRNDLAAYAEVQKQQQTPAEQALTAARDEGKTEGINSERTKAAAAIFRGALEAGGVQGDDLDELVANFNVAGYITADGVDTTKITNFAKRFASGTDNNGNGQRRRDFGGGTRGDGRQTVRGAAGKAEAERRFKTTS